MMNLDEMLSREKIRVTVEVDGERRGYTEDFLIMHMTDEGGEVLGCVGSIGLVRAVDMLMDSVTEIIEHIPPHEQMMVSMMLLDCIKRRMKDE